MNIDISTLFQFGSFAVTIVGVPFALIQLRRLNRTARSNAVSVLYERSAKLREYFIDRPDFRQYFYDDIEIKPDHEDYLLVVTIAENYLNFQEHKTYLRTELGSDWKAWKAGRDGVIANSPIMRTLIKKSPEKYTREFQKAAEL